MFCWVQLFGSKNLFFRQIIFLILSICLTESSFASSKVKIANHKPLPVTLIIDPSNNKVLYARNSKRKVHPASLTKLMTIYIAFENLQSKKWSLKDDMTVSKNASCAKPCKLGLIEGEKIKFKEAILATIIKSANDAARTIADNIAGSEKKFVHIMNKKATLLGMHDTVFCNASGWHDPKQKTTAKDLVKLAIALKKDFPEYYHIFAMTSFTYKGKAYHGHNNVVKNYAGAEGMKTGYISASGYNLITSARRSNKRLIGVIIGGASAKERDGKMVALLDKYFAQNSKKVVKIIKTKGKIKAKQIITSSAKRKVNKSA